MDPSTQNVAQGLTSGDWLGIIGVMATLAGVLGMIIFNMVMKRLDSMQADIKSGNKVRVAQGKTLTAICTKLGVTESPVEDT